MASLHYFLVRVTLVEQELLTIPEHLSSPPVFSGVRVTRSLVLYVCFYLRILIHKKQKSEVYLMEFVVTGKYVRIMNCFIVWNVGVVTSITLWVQIGNKSFGNINKEQFKDTKGLTRSHRSTNHRQWNDDVKMNTTVELRCSRRKCSS
jgi:hypothetical protein